MKKIILCLMLVVVTFGFSSCSRKFELVDISPDKYAILVPVDGDTKTQATYNSIEFFEKNLVSGKRITIPYERVAMGDGTHQNLPKFNLYQVARAPVTRLYYSEGTKVGDKPGFATETKTSVGVTIGFSVGARITNPAKFLYWKRGTELTKFLDDDVYGMIASQVSANVAKYDEKELLASKMKISSDIQKNLNDMLADFGIEIYSLGMFGGIIFDNPKIQEAIDEQLIQSAKLDAARQEVLVAEERKKLIPYEQALADIKLKNAMASYIDKAGDKGIVLVPQTSVSSGTSGVMLALPTLK